MEIILQRLERGPEGDAESRAAHIGQAPGFVLASTDCHQDRGAPAEKGAEMIEPPMEMPWGISALFADLYGYVHTRWSRVNGRGKHHQLRMFEEGARASFPCALSLRASRSNYRERGANHPD